MGKRPRRRDHGEEMSRALGFTRELTPSVATLHRVFSRLDVEEFERISGKWMRANGLDDAEAVAVDGKSLLGELDIKGRVVTGDAQFTQRADCETIASKGGTTFS